MKGKTGAKGGKERAPGVLQNLPVKNIKKQDLRDPKKEEVEEEQRNGLSPRPSHKSVYEHSPQQIACSLSRQ